MTDSMFTENRTSRQEDIHTISYWFELISLLNGISIFEGYLMLNIFYRRTLWVLFNYLYSKLVFLKGVLPLKV